MAFHDPIGSSKDPHMKNPFPKFILIVIIVIVLAFIGYKAYEIISEEESNTEERAKDGEKSEVPARDK